MKITSPRTTGIRDAKAHLSDVLRRVQRGEEWTITERGKPIARIVPIVAEQTLEARLQRLCDAGVLESHVSPSRERLSPIKLPASVERNVAQRYLQEDRGE